MQELQAALPNPGHAMKLRDYQVQVVCRIRAKRVAGINRLLLKMATGLGKTPLFSALPDELGFTGRMMVLDHRTELTDQALNKLKQWNPGRTVGVEMGDRSCDGAQLVVAGVQTIGRKGSPRLLKFDPMKFDALVIDEAHHATAQSYRTVIDHFAQNPKILILGVTATPNRADGKGLGEIFQEIVADKDILFGIRSGWLADMRGVRIKTGVNLSGVHNRVGDFDQAELGTTVNTYARNDLIARSWSEHAAGRKTVIFSVDVQHAKDIASAFKRYGVAAEAVWGGDPDRNDKLRFYKSGALKVLVNCELLTEGFDDWATSCIGIARPTQSEGLYTQMVGRGTRIPGDVDNLLEARKRGQFIAKEDCILLGWVDATSKHSLVTLATLFGMGQDMDLCGKAISKVAAEIEEVRKRNPLLDLTQLKDVTQLQSYAEQVDLFKVVYPPEVIQPSKYQWRKLSSGVYILSLLGEEAVYVIHDILDKWHILGDINGCKVNDIRPSFDEAIKEADFKVGLLGGRPLQYLIQRDPKWGRGVPATAAQLALCSRFRIVVPPGATKGEVSAKLSLELSKLKQKRIQRVEV